MNKIVWRKLNKDEVIQHGDMVVEDCEFDMNLSREQLESWVKTHNRSGLIRMQHAFNWVGETPNPTPGVWPVWRIEVGTPEPTSEPTIDERKIEPDL